MSTDKALPSAVQGHPPTLSSCLVPSNRSACAAAVPATAASIAASRCTTASRSSCASWQHKRSSLVGQQADHTRFRPPGPAALLLTSHSKRCTAEQQPTPAQAPRWHPPARSSRPNAGTAAPHQRRRPPAPRSAHLQGAVVVQQRSAAQHCISCAQTMPEEPGLTWLKPHKAQSRDGAATHIARSLAASSHPPAWPASAASQRCCVAMA